MKNALIIVLVLLGVGGVLLVAKGWTVRRLDPKVAKFNQDAENLIMGIQQYKEFVGTYPEGNNVMISRALLGQTEKKVLILAVRRAEMNDKGEILDPWGTPLRIYFAGEGILVRSAGPNKRFDDSTVLNPDDYYRSN